MLKIPKEWSVYLSMVLAIVMIGVCVAYPFFAGHLVGILVHGQNYGAGENLTLSQEQGVLMLGYLVVAVMAVVGVLLFWLLWRVKKEWVFTAGSISLIRAIAWCCFLAAGLIGVIGIWIPAAFLGTFLVAFLGVCLRVVKNVIEEATQIKTENDLTV